MAVKRAQQMVMASHACLLVMDAAEGLTRGDLQIADLILKHQKSCIVLANKLDLLSDEDARAKLPDLLVDRLPMLRYAPVVPGSVLEGDGIEDAMALVLEAARWRGVRVPRRQLNELFARAQILRPLPYVKASKATQAGRLRIRYVLQAPTEAPTFVCHMNRSADLHTSDVQWIENTLRSQWAFTGTPLRLVFRTRETRARRQSQARKEYGRRRNARTRNVKRKMELLGGGVAQP